MRAEALVTRSSRPGAWAALMAVLAAAIALAGSPAATAMTAGDGWSIVNRPTVRHAWLEATSTVGNGIWAVGLTTSAGPLAEYWDGTSWARTATHVKGWAGFWGVSGSGPRDVWAVGSHSLDRPVALIEHWNGARWRFVSSPIDLTRPEQLLGVWAASPTDAWAVGYRGKHPLIEHWNGLEWRVVRTPAPPNGGGFESIAGSGPKDIWAVGFRGPAGWYPAFGTLVEHWDGSRWSIAHAPGASSDLALNSVAVVGPNDAWAVGGLPRDPIFSPDSRSVSMHWDGHRWTVVPTAGGTMSTDTLNGVAVTAKGDVWAVGEIGIDGCSCPLAERWDGRRWVASLPKPLSPEVDLNGVAGDGAYVWVVGGVFGFHVRTVIERRPESP